MKTTINSKMVAALVERKAQLEDAFREWIALGGMDVETARRVRGNVQGRIDRASRAIEYLRDRMAR